MQTFGAREFIERLEQYVRFTLPYYVQEGKSYLTVAVGCTGGRHRSVMIAERLRAALAEVRAAGVKVVGASDHTVTHSLYIEDPDGNEIELFIDVPGVDWRNDPSLLMSPVRPLAL